MSLTPAQRQATGAPGPLYRQLTPRPHGPAREAVVRNQRARLFGAIAAAVAAHGYETTSVAEVCRLAGVSKRTFYEQFEHREACFGAAHRHAVECARRRAEAACAAGGDWESQVESALGAVLRWAAERPAAARLAVVDAPGVASLRPSVEGARLASERALAACFAGSPSGEPLSPLLAHALLCGVRRVLRRHLLAGTEGELPGLAAPLAGWIAAYAAGRPPALAGVPPAPCVPPRFAGERALILRAAAELFAESGSARPSPGQIVDRAGVARDACDGRYPSAEACVREAVEVAGLEVLVAAGAALRGTTAWPQAVHRALASVLGQLARDRVLARLAVTVAAAPPPLAGTAEHLLRGFSELLAKPVPRELLPPDAVLDALTGAVWGLVARHIRHRPAHRLPELTAQATYLVLAPVLGARPAVAAIRGEALGLAA